MAEELTLEDIRPMELPPLPDNPLVSVLIANYNYAQYIGEAIESVLNQTYQNFEIVICDDGSTDNSLEVIRNYAQRDSRIKYIAKQNGGVASALNAAYSESKGEIISLLDADDTWFPSRLEIIVKLFRQRPIPGMVMHPLKVIDKKGRVLKDKHPAHLDQGWLAPVLLTGKYPSLAPASGLSFHRDVADRIFPVPEHFRSWGDRVLHERAALLGRVASTERVLGTYVQHGANVTGSTGSTTPEALERRMAQLQMTLEARARFIEEHYGLSVNPELWFNEESKHLRLALDLLSGRRPQLKELVNVRVSKRWVWILIFSMPYELRMKAFRWWWGEGFGKRWARFLARILHV